MIILILVIIFFLLSLLVFFRAPTKLLWYASILITEFSWVFAIVLGVVLLSSRGENYRQPTIFFGLAGIAFYLVPIAQAIRLRKKLMADFASNFGSLPLGHSRTAFSLFQIFTGLLDKKIAYQRLVYDRANRLDLHFYSSPLAGKRPCVIIIHGGSWAGGNNLQLPGLNSRLALAGYHVASIHYRLAPANQYPCQLMDVQSAIEFLCSEASALSIDANSISLLGRSAGGQIALSAAYRLGLHHIKSVIAFYAPTDMIWGYQHRCNPLVLDSRKVMRDYLGGSLQQVNEQYHKSSPTETVTVDAPPTLLLYAENDPLVSPRHGNRLTKKLEEKGIRHFAVYLPWATHGFDYSLNGPGGQLSTWTVLQFLNAIHSPVDVRQ